MENQNNNIELPIEVLPNGELRFFRSTNEEENQKLMEILFTLTNKNQDEIKDFLNKGKDISLLFGDRIFCG